MREDRHAYFDKLLRANTDGSPIFAGVPVLPCRVCGSSQLFTFDTVKEKWIGVYVGVDSGLVYNVRCLHCRIAVAAGDTHFYIPSWAMKFAKTTGFYAIDIVTVHYTLEAVAKWNKLMRKS